MVIKISLLISIISLFIAICSIFYTFSLNSNSIFIKTKVINSYYDPYKKIIISLFSNTNKPLIIKNVVLLKNGKIVKDNGYDPIKAKKKYTMERNSRPGSFSVPEIELSPMTSEEMKESENFSGSFSLNTIGMPSKLSYWINKNDIPDTIKITADKRLSLFSKTKEYKLDNKQ